MIPKKIHYCWFGRGPKPALALKCIESWKKYLPDYEIIEWNEESFDVNAVPYTAEAYEARKYAFVSDYARFKILYDQGGLYFDTDVEVIKPFDEIVEQGPFMGYETDPDNDRFGTVAAGLGIGAESGMPIFQKILEYYEGLHFETNPNGALPVTVVTHTTNILKDEGLRPEQGIQTVANITIYPSEYFGPKSIKDGKIQLTKNTHSIHHYSESWLPKRRRIARAVILKIGGYPLKRFIKKIIGRK